MNESTTRAPITGPLLLALALLATFFFGLRTISGPDFWLHLTSGRHVAESGIAHEDPFSFGLAAETTWRQTTWLYDWLLFRIWQLGGAPLTILLHAILAPLALAALIRIAAPNLSRTQQAAAVLICSWLLAPTLHAGPRLPALLLVAIFMRVLATTPLTSGRMAILLIIQIAWTNLHLSFFLGPLLAGLAAIEHATNLRRAKKTAQAAPAGLSVTKTLTLAALLLGATIANPFGINIYRELANTISQPGGIGSVDWISPFFNDYLPIRQDIATYLVLALVAITFILRRDRLPLMLTCTAVLGAFAMVRTGHFIDFAAVLCFPFMILGTNTIANLRFSRLPWLKNAASLAVGLACLITIGATITNRYYIATGSGASFGLNENRALYPGALLKKIENRLPASMINIAQDGGYLLWHNPGQKVYTDTRARLYGPAFYTKLFLSLTGQNDHEGLGVPLPEGHAILLNGIWPGSRATLVRFLSDDAWSIAYFDGTSILLLRRDEANKPLLEDESLAREGLAIIQRDFSRYEQALEGHILRPALPARLVGAAATYQVMGRFTESLALYELITKGAPRMASAWLNRGIAEGSLGKIDAAVVTLEHATALMPDNALGWLWLGRAYKAQGKQAGAEAATARGRELNPDLAERFSAERKQEQR